jgi:hypothetical protein
VNAADGQNPFKPRVYPTAECRIVPLGQVATSEGGVGCSKAVQRSKFTHGWQCSLRSGVRLRRATGVAEVSRL